MKALRTERLILRNWEHGDRAAFERLNADDSVMRFFPFRRTRAESDALLDRLRAEIATRGYGFGAAERRDTGECIGFVGIKADPDIPSLPSDCVEIGWRFLPEAWGHGYATEAAREWLRFAFEELRLPEIVALAVVDNSASLAVMERIGMSRDPDGDFDHPRVPDDRPELKRHALYRLAAKDWQKRRKAAT